jgi:hypothetical protein
MICILVIFILTNVIDYFDYVERKYIWIGKWYDYPLYTVDTANSAIMAGNNYTAS